MNKLLLNTVILAFFAMVGINIANATEVKYNQYGYTCTLIPNATITSNSDVARSTIDNESGEVVIEPNSCMQATLPDADADATTATVVFGAHYGGSKSPITIYVTQNQHNPWQLSTVDSDPDTESSSRYFGTWDNNDTEHLAIKNMVLQKNNDFVIYDNGNDLIWNSGITSDWHPREATLSLRITTYHDNDYIVELYLTRFTNVSFLPVAWKWTTVIHRAIYGSH